MHDEILRQDPSLHWAAEAVVEAAERVAVGRPALRAAEDELVGGIVAVQAARGSANGGKDVLVCPFKGLASFDVDDADFFFGRERLVAELVACQTGAPLTALVGRFGEREVLRCCAPAWWRRWPQACCRAATAGRSRCCARAPTRCARWRRRRLEAAPTGRPRPGRRPVRGAVHRVPRRGGALLVRRCARGLRPRRAPARGRAPGDPRRLLRALRRLPRAGAPARGEPRPRRADAARRAAAGDRAARPPRRAGSRAGGHGRACSPAWRASPARCRCCRHRCSSCGNAVTATCCGSPTTRSSAGSRERSPGWRSVRTSGSHRSSETWRGASCCAS